MANTAPARGVPMSAEKAAAIPERTRILRSGFLQTEDACHSVSYTSTQLKSSSFTSNRSSAEMGENGGDEDERSHAKGNIGAFPDGGEDQICSARMISVCQVVDEENQHGTKGGEGEGSRGGSDEDRLPIQFQSRRLYRPGR